MTIRHCRIHGRYSDPDGCWECRQREKRAEAQAEAQAEANRRGRQQYDSSNSSRGSKDYGDYTCPHCGYKTLRSGARRCPECHADPGGEFWAMHYGGEERIRQIKEKDAAAERAKEREQERDIFFYWYVYYVLPILIILSQASITGALSKEHHFIEFVFVLLPIFNWGTAVVLFVTDTKGDFGVVLLVILFWVLIGLLLRPILRRPKKSN